MIKLFKNERFTISVYTDKNQIQWFKGKNVAKYLGYKITKKAIYDHVDDEDKIKFSDLEKTQVRVKQTDLKIKGGKTPTLQKQGGSKTEPPQPHTIFINESGLYSLVLSSKLPNAKEFKHWVTS